MKTMSISTAFFFFLSPPPLPPLSTFTQPSFFPTSKFKHISLQTTSRRNPFLTRIDDADFDSVGPDIYDIDDYEMEEVDNKTDFDIEYETPPSADADIALAQSTSFVSTQGWDPDTLVDYRINEDEFHKISLLDCDFFIRKPPDPDNDVYDFREVGINVRINLDLHFLFLLLF